MKGAINTIDATKLCCRNNNNKEKKIIWISKRRYLRLVFKKRYRLIRHNIKQK